MMKKSVAHFFLTCSIVLVLGHSILPHNHVDIEQNVYEYGVSKHLSLSEIFKIALTNNLGTNHLEEFHKFEKSFLIHKVSLTELNVYIAQTDITNNFSIMGKTVLFPEGNCNDGCLVTNSQLRAPPSKS